jgi:ribonuclease E
VLRRLTESLARDRTRHQVSEVTSLGLVQLTRKRLGTGLVEAFSTSCPNCGGRGILLHADPVDSAAATGRKSESGGRRGKRSKKRSDESVVAKVPAHAPGEHPMFKAMAAGSSTARDEDESGEAVEEAAAEIDEQTVDQGPADLEDIGQDDFEDTDEDTEEDEDVDEDDEDELDDDTEDEDDLVGDEDLDDDDEDDEDDDDEDLDLDDDLDLDESESESDGNGGTDIAEVSGAAAVPVDTASAFERPRRRRAAGRPAGPPIHVD